MAGGGYSEGEIKGMVERTFGQRLHQDRADARGTAGAARGDGARERADRAQPPGLGGAANPPPGAPSPDDIGPPVVALCSIGEKPAGRLWDTVRWHDRLTLLVGPGVTLTLRPDDVSAIHAALGRVLIAMQADGV